MLTMEILRVLSPHSIFAAGVFRDVVDGVSISGDAGRLLKWVAVRGEIPDWAVYVGEVGDLLDEIARSGDKISTLSASVLVACDEEAQSMYRR